MADENLVIGIKVEGGKTAVDLLGQVGAVVKSITKDSDKLSTKLNKAMSSLSQEIRVLSAAVDLNKKYEVAQQKIQQEINKTITTNQKMQQEIEKTYALNIKNAQGTLKLSQLEATSQQKIQQEVERTNILKEKSAQTIFKTIQAEATAQQKIQQEINKTATTQEKLEQNVWRTIKSELQAESASLRLGNQINKMSDNAQRATNIFNNMGTVINVAIGNIAARVIELFVTKIKDMVANVSQAGVALDGIRNTFAAGARGWKQGGEEMQFVADMANKLGLNLQATYEPYAKFMTSFTRSGGTLAESRQIFEDLSTAMVSLHLPASRMEGVFVALEQMANKGTVQAEELKRQLGNALPGAFELAAQSMNITARELMDLMRDGKVMSREFLPKFAAMVKDSLGKQVGIAVDQYNAHLNRLQSQTWILQANIGQAWNLALTPIVKFASSTLKILNDIGGGFLRSAAGATAFQTALIALGVVAASNVLKMQALSGVIRLMTVNLPVLIRYVRMLTASLTAAQVAGGVITAGLTLLAGGVLYVNNKINEANQSFSEQAVKITDVTNEVTGLITEYDSLSKITNKSTAQQEAFNRVLGDLKSGYPELLSYIQDNGINLKNLTKEQANNIASMAVQYKMQEAELAMQAELSNGWVKFGNTVKRIGQAIILFIQGVEAFVGHTVVTAGQGIAKLLGGVSKLLGEVTEKGAFVMSVLGRKDVAVQLDNMTKSLKSFAENSWNWGNDIHNNLTGAMEQLNREFEDNVNVQERLTKLHYKNVIADLGVEQQKLADSLMYASSAQASYNKAQGKSKKSHKEKVKHLKTEFQELEALTNKQREQLEVLAKNSKSKDEFLEKNKKLIEEYQKNVKTIENVKKQIDDLTKAQENQASLWDKIVKKQKETAKNYEYMTFNSQDFTSNQINEARQLSKSYNAIVQYSEALKQSDGVMKITSRTARDLTNTLVDGLFEPLKEGESVWTRFADAGKSAIKAIATEWIKNKMNLMLTGAQAGWGVGSIGGGTLGQKFQLGLIGAGAGLTGQPLFGTKENNPFANNKKLEGVYKNFLQKIDANNVSDSAFTKLAEQAVGLGNTISSTATPAVSSLANSLTSSGGAGAGMTVLAGTANIAATAFTTAVPALMAMATALNAISASAATAATSMAALAVSTAAESVAKIPFVGGFLAPVAALATGAAIGAGAAMTGMGIAAGATVAGGGQMLGGVMSGIGSKVSNWGTTSKVIPHAKGGIVSSPTMFPMQGGNVGLAGEAGTEVIAPARRMSNGEVGVGAVQPQVTVNNYTNSAVEVIKRPNNEMEIKITELNAMLSSSRTNRGMASAQSRMNTQGRRIG